MQLGRHMPMLAPPSSAPALVSPQLCEADGLAPAMQRASSKPSQSVSRSHGSVHAPHSQVGVPLHSASATQARSQFELVPTLGSFGSCSFDEPVGDLQTAGVLR